MSQCVNYGGVSWIDSSLGLGPNSPSDKNRSSVKEPLFISLGKIIKFGCCGEAISVIFQLSSPLQGLVFVCI